ncbi:3-oxoacyl-acyl-carrier protein reductase [Fusarium austroafricanum]|uniref:3-oxoacyl-acyl-carrier protein reductase n=1 Tax=Fusarium austroafricanum TaxID=2364996 RepID=A0A8H4NTZ8_9HYPO|nr:3-oxoacyl-acyl-carrier protein reductase [Fusarium austroafricanum]
MPAKAALTMVGRLLSVDLKGQGVIVSIAHPGFMRTEMTKGVGFDKFWDEGGDKAAASLIEWTDKLDISKTGEYWALRGLGDIGTAEVVLGKTWIRRHSNCLGKETVQIKPPQLPQHYRVHFND